MKNLIRHCMRSWRHHFSLQIATVLVLSMVLIILSFVFGVKQNLGQLNSIWGDNLEMTVYVKDKVEPGAVSNFVRELESKKDVGEVAVINKEEALHRFIARMGSLAPDFVRSNDFDNPLPTSIEIRLKEGSTPKAKVETMRGLAQEIARNQVVEDVSYGQGWIENWAGFLTSVQLMSGAAVALTILLGLLVIGNSVRVSLSQRREEIEIMELVGATARWIRIPFIIEGAMLGLFASTIAFSVGSVLQALAFDYLKSSLAFWSVFQELHPLNMTGWICVSLIGMTFGAFGAYVCVRNINSGWSAAERGNV
jgi:cell division transport system permease protein